jgi:cytochrome c peroxidase
VIGVPDVPGQETDLGRAEAAGGKPYEHAFKVPTLRNVALTAPYMHNGRFKTLEEVVLFYQKGGGRGQGSTCRTSTTRSVLSLTAKQRDPVAFLGALTDESR